MSEIANDRRIERLERVAAEARRVVERLDARGPVDYFDLFMALDELDGVESAPAPSDKVWE